MYCKNCGKPISGDAAFCDGCGKRVSAFNDDRTKEKVGFILAIVASILFAITALIAIFGLREPGSDSNVVNNPEQNNGTASGSSVNYWGDGMYKVGSDIPAGEYFVYCDTTLSCYWAVHSDSSGQLTSIVANDNIQTFAFVSVKDGQYLVIEGGKFVKAEDAEVPGQDGSGNYGPGMYRVGIDIIAGEYKVTCIDGKTCYLEVSSDCTGSLYSIISNNIIDSSAYITVVEGQYLTVENGFFTAAK